MKNKQDLARGQMEQIPEHDWFCPTCQEKSIWQAEELRGKKKITKNRRSLVHYLVHWTGYTTDDDTWESRCPTSSASMGGGRDVAVGPRLPAGAHRDAPPSPIY